MARVPVFYSFHYDNDAMRIQQVRNIGALEGNEPVSANTWESVRKQGDAAIQRWIDENMKYRRCVIVLVGSETYYRPWVQYEIKKAWMDRKGLFGVHIHNLNCPRTGTCAKGPNPFSYYSVGNRSMADLVPCYDPHFLYAYTEIAQNLENWVSDAIKAAKIR